MPLNKLVIMGEPVIKRQPNDFVPQDWDLLSSEKAVAKIRRQLENCPYIFNFYILFDASHTRRSIHSNYHYDEKLKYFQNVIGMDLQVSGEISVVYTNNITSPVNRMPMNGWTLVHRIGHGLQLYWTGISTFDPKDFEFSCWKSLIRINNVMSERLAHFTGAIIQPADPIEQLLGLSQAIMTMRSAREWNIRNNLDVSPELLAQYVMTGRIRLNRFEHWHVAPTPKIHDGWYHPKHVGFDVKNLDFIIQEEEHMLNQHVATMLTNLKGHCVFF